MTEEERMRKALEIAEKALLRCDVCYCQGHTQEAREQIRAILAGERDE